jgi:hypothetical protein
LSSACIGLSSAKVSSRSSPGDALAVVYHIVDF